MFRRRLVLVLMLAVAMGLLTSYLVYRTVKAATGQQADTEEILVAGVNIGLGEALTPKHVKLSPWPKPTVPPGSLRSVKDAEGRVSRASMLVGEPVLDAKLAPAGQGGLMPVLVPTGKRAVSILVDQAVQRSGFVLPNSRVDVLVTMARPGGQNKEARIVLQDVMVLAADQTVEMKDNKPVSMFTVTMALSPEEAERLALAQNEGKVTFALRNLQDTARVVTPGVTSAQLLGSPPPGAARDKAPASASRPSAKQGSKTALKAASQSKSPPPGQVSPTPQTPPPLPAHTVSVVRGVTSTEYSFIRDADRGWMESPGKGDAGRKSQ